MDADRWYEPPREVARFGDRVFKEGQAIAPNLFTVSTVRDEVTMSLDLPTTVDMTLPLPSARWLRDQIDAAIAQAEAYRG